jgi:hypothetical protein
MLAVLHVTLPFAMLVPLETEFALYSTVVDGYEVVFDLPKSSGRPTNSESPDYVTLNDKPTYVADALDVRFRKESFERGVDAEIDPSAQIINAVVGSFLERLKFVARAPQARRVMFPHCPWHLRYLADDGTELQMQAGFVRGRFTEQFSFSYVAIYPEVWDSIHSLPHGYVMAPWQTLLIDARGALPHVGTAVVLAATALEVFISEVLTQLAKESRIPGEL